MRAKSCLAANISATEMFENALDLNCCMAIALATVSGMFELILSDLNKYKNIFWNLRFSHSLKIRNDPPILPLMKSQDTNKSSFYLSLWVKGQTVLLERTWPIYPLFYSTKKFLVVRTKKWLLYLTMKTIARWR